MIRRRSWLQGCSAWLAALCFAQLSGMALASPQSPPGDALLVVSLRGGWDVLSVLPPLLDADRDIYEKARPSLKIPTATVLPLDGTLGLHPSARPLFELYRQGHLGVVCAVGLDHDTRSHFDAIEFIEQGTPGRRGGKSGWLARHLQARPAAEAAIAALQIGSPSSCLAGYPQAVVLSSDQESWAWENTQEQIALLDQLYRGESDIQVAGREALRVSQRLGQQDRQTYRPRRGASYPESDFSSSLQAVARLPKAQVGLQVATVELEGWDTHEEQGAGAKGYLAALLHDLSRSLQAFYADVAGQPVTVVVMSEFGRRLAENANEGTDHGHGSAMLVLGEKVAGGKVYGKWPGLAKEQLYDLEDLAVTTDYRQVLGEIVERRLGNPHLDQVFPGYTGYRPLGLCL